MMAFVGIGIKHWEMKHAMQPVDPRLGKEHREWVLHDFIPQARSVVHRVI